MIISLHFFCVRGFFFNGLENNGLYFNAVNYNYYVKTKNRDSDLGLCMSEFGYQHTLMTESWEV